MRILLDGRNVSVEGVEPTGIYLKYYVRCVGIVFVERNASLAGVDC